MDFILDNLGIVIFLVLALGVRALQSWVKARNRQNKPPPQAFASGLEPDGDDEPFRRLEPDEDEDQAGGLIGYAQTRGASAYVVEKAHALLERLIEKQEQFAPRLGLPAVEAASPRAEASPKPFTPPASAPPSAAYAAPPAEASPARRRPGKPAVLNLENLAPLQRAVVWAEVLGKPRGMELFKN
jgi:hypothetical protein